MAFFTKSGGIWRAIQNLWVKQSGSWSQVQNAWVKQGGVWRQFYSAVSLPLSIQYFMVGGGGRGNGYGGGGGAAVIPWTTLTTIPPTIDVVIGLGGIVGRLTGTASTISGTGLSVSCAGGGGASGNNGAASGSGRTGGTPGGFNFSPGGGGGGGFSGNGGNGSNTGWGWGCPNYRASVYGGRGGDGYILPVDLQNLLGYSRVAGGGRGNATNNRTASGTCRYCYATYSGVYCYNATAYFNTNGYPGTPGAGSDRFGGGGGGGGGNGIGGVVIFKYTGTPVATGGTISYISSTNTTYHRFTSNGTLTF